MSPEMIMMAVCAAPIVAYLVVRFASAAFFKSKQQYESEKQR